MPDLFKLYYFDARFYLFNFPQARARQLNKAGYHSLQKLAAAQPSLLASDIEHLTENQVHATLFIKYRGLEWHGIASSILNFYFLPFLIPAQISFRILNLK